MCDIEINILNNNDNLSFLSKAIEYKIDEHFNKNNINNHATGHSWITETFNGYEDYQF